MTSPLVSVIVPVYKVEEYIHRCVDSILAQTLSDIEIIMVDDGSPDHCPGICDAYAEKDSRIRVIHKEENGGLSDARNAGISVACGEFLAFVDSDDWIRADMYEKMYDKAHVSGADMVFCDVVLMDHNNHPFSDRYTAQRFPDRPVNSEEALACLFDGKVQSYAFEFIARRELFISHRVTFPTGRLYEDMATTYRLIGNSKKIDFVSDGLYYYYQNKRSITHQVKGRSASDVYSAVVEMEQYVQQNYPSLLELFRVYEVNCLVYSYILYCKSLYFGIKRKALETLILKKLKSQMDTLKLKDYKYSPYLLKLILMKLGLLKPAVFMIQRFRGIYQK